MDPITAATTLITFVSFMQELIQLGQSIADSIEKVSENRRQIRELANDILRMLSDLADLTRGREEEVQTPALLAALGSLKAEMLHALDVCRHTDPVEQKSRLRELKSQFKGWRKRDKVEAEIRRLKENVSKCLLTFSAFSAARVEQTTAQIVHTTKETQHAALDGIDATLRVEQRIIVDGVESQVKMRKLETMMAKVLLETSFGQSVMERTIRVISSDQGHVTIESQYVSTQTLRLIPLVQRVVSGGAYPLDPTLWMPNLGLLGTGPISIEHVLHSILGALLQLNAPAMEMDVMNDAVIRLGFKLRSVGMYSEAVAWELLVCDLLRRLLDEQNRSVVMPRLARALRRLSLSYKALGQTEDALRASGQAIEFWRLLSDGASLDVKSPGAFDNHIPFIDALFTHLVNLQDNGQHDTALSLSLLEEAVTLARCDIAASIAHYKPEDKDWSEQDAYAGRLCCSAFFRYSAMLSVAKRPVDSCAAAVEGLRFMARMPKTTAAPIIIGPVVDRFIHQLCIICETSTFTFDSFSAHVALFQSLAELLPDDFAVQFVRLLHAYAYLCSQERSEDGPDCLPCDLRVFLEPSFDVPIPALPPYHHPLYGHLIGSVDAAISAFFFRPKEFSFDLILNLFMAHPALATLAFERAVNNALDAGKSDPQLFDWMVHTILEVRIGLMSSSERCCLATLLQRICSVHGAMLLRFCPDCTLSSARRLWLEGMAVDANNLLGVYLGMGYEDGVSVQDTLLMRVAILWDLGHVEDAVAVMQDVERSTVFTGTLPMSGSSNHTWFPFYCRLRIQLLRRTGRTQELREFLEELLPGPVVEPQWDDRSGILAQDDLQYVLALLEHVAIKRESGERDEALTDAQLIVEMCRRSPDDPVGDEFRLCGLVYALVALGKCFAIVGRDDEAATAYREAVSVCDAQKPSFWMFFLQTTRKQDIIATAHNALLLSTGGGVEYEKHVIGRYRALAIVSPRHRLVLAESLCSLARMLPGTGHAVSACEEAVSILRDLVEKEPYLVPVLADALELLGRLVEGTDGVAPVRKEAQEMRLRAQSLSVSTDELFRPLRMLRTSSSSVVTPQRLNTLSSFDSDSQTLVDDLDAEGSVERNADAPAELAAKVGDGEVKVNGSVPVVLEEPVLPSLKTVLRTPAEIQFRATPMDLLWWGLVVVLSGLVVVLGVVVALLVRRDAVREISSRNTQLQGNQLYTS
ncbi:Tetratricopeptide repeat family [Mycena chlorophos]|uniref:Tetratricopeptide repeat family n=1 Tax=Mycena chlorophos TaxID=658473 RepID=A0A8H6W7G2_MYCCL|nr:Tetratricopeptide repeat family [Mycena chlorophos]